MSIKDLLPWRRKSEETKVPIRVGERGREVSDPDVRRGTGACEPWRGLTPLGPLSDRWVLLGPRMDMVESRRTFTLTVEVPGMDKKDIEVTLEGERLIVRGRTEDEDMVGRGDRYPMRRSRESFRRSIVLPRPVDADQTEARLSRGVLTITLPKEEASR